MRIGEARHKRFQQHHCRDITHDIPHHRYHHGKYTHVLQIPVAGNIQQLAHDSGILSAANDNEQPDKKNEQAPVHFAIEILWFEGSGDEKGRRTEGGHHGVAMARDTGGNFYIAEGNLLKKYAPNLSKLIYSRRFKGASISAIFVDSFNQLYLTGTTFDPTLRAVHAAQPELGGEVDAFVIALTAAGNRITYSSFIGGKGNERAAGLSVDEEGNVFVAGTDLSFAWDGRPDPCDTGDANCSEGLYVAKFGPLRISQLPGKIEFGPRNVGSTTTKKILLTNLGNVPLRVSNVQLSSSDFVETNTCVAPILPDKACTISVSFKPSSQGTQVTTMVVVSDSLKSPQRVRLTGQGR